MADVLFAQSEVCQHNVSAGVQENVLRLQVSVDDVEVVQVAKCRCDLGCIEPAVTHTHTYRVHIIQVLWSVMANRAAHYPHRNWVTQTHEMCRVHWQTHVHVMYTCTHRQEVTDLQFANSPPMVPAGPLKHSALKVHVCHSTDFKMQGPTPSAAGPAHLARGSSNTLSLCR